MTLRVKTINDLYFPLNLPPPLQAARNGNESLVNEWIGKCDLNALDADGYAAMHYAAKFNRLKIIELLESNGAGKLLKCSC